MCARVTHAAVGFVAPARFWGRAANWTTNTKLRAHSLHPWIVFSHIIQGVVDEFFYQLAELHNQVPIVTNIIVDTRDDTNGDSSHVRRDNQVQR